MNRYSEIEELFDGARAPRSGSTSWYDACDLLTIAVKARLREQFRRGFNVEVYGDEVGLIVRVRGDGYGVGPWSVDRAMDFHEALERQIEELVPAVEACVAKNYCHD